MTTTNTTEVAPVERLRAELGEIEMGVVTAEYGLADAIREGAGVTDQRFGAWVSEGESCALGAAWIAAAARGLA